MLRQIIVLVLFINVLNVVFAKCKDGQDEKICMVVRCANVQTCPAGQHLIKRDPQKCICCNFCECDTTTVTTTTEPASECNSEEGKDSSYCERVDCQPAKCCNKGQHIVKADLSKCICCDKCVDDSSK